MSRRTKERGGRTRAAVRAAALVLFPLPLVLGAAGCRHGKSDLIEAELRSRDQDLREIRDELHRSEAYSEALQRELRAVRESTPTSLTPEKASQTYTLKS